MRRVTRHNNVGGLSEAKTLWPLDSLPPTSFLGGRWSLKKYTSNNNYAWCVRAVHGNVFPSYPCLLNVTKKSLSAECHKKSLSSQCHKKLSHTNKWKSLGTDCQPALLEAGPATPRCQLFFLSISFSWSLIKAPHSITHINCFVRSWSWWSHLLTLPQSCFTPGWHWNQTWRVSDLISSTSGTQSGGRWPDSCTYNRLTKTAATKGHPHLARYQQCSELCLCRLWGRQGRHDGQTAC